VDFGGICCFYKEPLKRILLMSSAHLVLAIALTALLSSLIIGHQSNTGARKKYDSQPFDSSVTELPEDYYGVDERSLYTNLIERKSRAKKDEFETTEQWRLRVQREAAAPIIGNLTTESIMALQLATSVAYDADLELMSVTVFPADDPTVELTGYKGRGFTANLKMDIPAAKKTKSNLSALAVFKLLPPYTRENSRPGKIVGQLQELWLYDISTGKVFMKMKPEDGGNIPHPLVAKASKLYQAGRDDEALAELHRVTMIEPTNAESYLLVGRINLRRGDAEAAISALKTAVFWDPKLIDAHILLGRVFLNRGDRSEAMKHINNAITLDGKNQDALALQRELEKSRN